MKFKYTKLSFYLPEFTEEDFEQPELLRDLGKKITQSIPDEKTLQAIPSLGKAMESREVKATIPELPKMKFY